MTAQPETWQGWGQGEPPEIMLTIEAARYLRRSPRTLDTWASKNRRKGPRFLPGRPRLYRRSDLDQWNEAIAVGAAVTVNTRGSRRG